MSALVDTLKFTNLATPSVVVYDFKGDGNDVQVFTPQITPRGSARSKMGMHGDHQRRPLFSGVTIVHEGIFIADTQEDLIAERDALLYCLLGDLTASPFGTKLGTLTVKYLGQSESATGDVSIDGYTAGFTGADLLTLAYQIQWRSDLPYFIGDTSSDPVYL